jgi:hypothetical protein
MTHALWIEGPGLTQGCIKDLLTGIGEKTKVPINLKRKFKWVMFSPQRCQPQDLCQPILGASRNPIITLKKNCSGTIRRFGDVIQKEFEIEPALTAPEAYYIRSFRDADSIRNRAAQARQERRVNWYSNCGH